MRKHKGKWVAAYKDTFCTTTLDAIILAHLVELYKHKDKDGFGVSMVYVDKQAKIQGLDKYSDDVDLQAAHRLQAETLEELIWTFTDNEPKMEDYDFKIGMVSGERSPDTGCVPCTIEVTCEEERDRYIADLTTYSERKEAGQKLFGSVYSTLSW
jgi:hypothetical protein